MAPATARHVQLSDKYTAERGTVLISGLQALVRLPLMQYCRDQAAGLDTAGFISGYRGSPLGGYDRLLWQAEPLLQRHRITFQPGINEDLAATAVWGSQQVGLFPGARQDGVFGLWYAKGPGVDRSGDALKHANMAGTSRHGGVLAVAGDDHGCKSSSLPHQSEYAFMAAGIPVLNPAGVGELLDFGLYGWAMSRFSGCWIGIKALAEQMDASETVAVDMERPDIRLPVGFPLPADGLNRRWPDSPPEQEARLLEHKLAAARAFARCNGLDRITHDSAAARLGIVASGKSWLDLMQTFSDLGLDERKLRMVGIRIYKVGLAWPLEEETALEFGRGLEQVLVVEEKRPLIEDQLRQILYPLPDHLRPRVTGKEDEQGRQQLAATMELSPTDIARVLARWLHPYYSDDAINARLRLVDGRERDAAGGGGHERLPHFCSGCPHSRSTRLPQGSRAMAGIGCHYMALWIHPDTSTFTHMGAEGATWLGQAPFTDETHVFQNMGDGTYYHSGTLAIRAAVAAGVSMTFKLLWNEAVAMTGGQPLEGNPGIPQLVAQLQAEGVADIALVSDQPERFRGVDLPGSLTPEDRSRLDSVQRRLRETPGVTVLIYAQSCATEKRRRRKRGLAPVAERRVVINEAVCEGCGDCGRQSGCLSIVPRDTPFGRKRQVDQTSCNSDYSCLDGFCPSFVTLRNATMRPPVQHDPAALDPPPEPGLPSADGPWRILIPGVGGTGVVTVSALLGMAAHLDNLHVRTLDQAGLAQKYGAVTSHVQIARHAGHLQAPRIGTGATDLLLAADLVVATGTEALQALDPERTFAVVNEHETVTGDFTRDGNAGVPVASLRQRLAAATRRCDGIDATALTTELLGDATTANVFLLGFAWQNGLLPITRQALEEAIRINGTAVEANLAAFHWGRHAAHDADRTRRLSGVPSPTARPESLAGRIRRHAEHLIAYQDRTLARRYIRLVRRARAVERRLAPGQDTFTMAVAESYGRLLAPKDEYEVARQLSSPAFLASLRQRFKGGRLEFHLAPPLLSRPDPETGRPRKHRFGPWLLPLLRLLARGKTLRGSRLDPFRLGRDRRLERQWCDTWEARLPELFAEMRADNLEIATEIAALPQTIRGFGPVKEEAASGAERRFQHLWRRLRYTELPETATADGNVIPIRIRAG